MKYSGASIIVLAGLMQATLADFNIYRVGLGGTGISGNAEGWQVYMGDANCDNAIDWIWRDSDDVSGGKYGVRCDGEDNACGRAEDDDPSNIDILEMNFNSDDRHWTYYKDREGALVDLDGNKVGTCSQNPGPELNCGLTVGRVVGWRKLKCVIDLTADDINDGRPTKKRSMRRVAM